MAAATLHFFVYLLEEAFVTWDVPTLRVFPSLLAHDTNAGNMIVGTTK